ncbi:MAG: hypothetical protein MJ178_04165 [Treponemataceae bacterium]|nr:hypothetical protein [Treponemataceae bacterium]
MAEKEKTDKPKVTFLLGAGCEVEYGIPSGADYKRDTIRAVNVKDFIKSLNDKEKNDILIPNNGTILTAHSTSVLYQTVKDLSDGDLQKIYNFDADQLTIIKKYLAYKNGEYDKQKDKDEIELIRSSFQEIYCNQFYLPIKDNESFEQSPYLNSFLKEGSFYSLIDSQFNYLRNPGENPDECRRVIKLYYATYLSLLKGLSKQQNFIPSGVTIQEKRKNLLTMLDTFENTILSNVKKTYYHKIKEFSSINPSFIVTTNQTRFIEKIFTTGDFAYVHGKMDLFEDIRTKRVDTLNNFSDEDFIFPFISVQSGVKPVICSRQIHEYEKATNALLDADEVIILGYGVNTDDEHITNILRERLLSKKNSITYMVYNDGSSDTDKISNEKQRIEKVMSIDITEKIKFKFTHKFDEVLSELSK